MLRALLSSPWNMYAFGIAVLPIVVIPFNAVSSYDEKGMIAGVLFGASCLLASLWYMRSREIRVLSCGVPVGIALTVFFLTALVSQIFSSVHVLTVWGLSFEPDTLGGVFLYTAAGLCALGMGEDAIRSWLRLFIVATSLATVASISVSLLAPRMLAGETIAGAWHQLALLDACAIVLILALLGGESSSRERVLYLACIAMCMIGLAVYMLPIAVALLGIGSLCVGLLRAFASRGVWSLVPFAIAIACATIFFWGAWEVQVKVNPDVRASWRATSVVIGAVYFYDLPRALVGSGPHTSAYSWETFRPAAFNNVGSGGDLLISETWSTMTTLALSLGFFGLAAFAAGPLLVFARLGEHMLVGTRERFDGNGGSTGIALVAFLFFLFAAAWMHPIHTMLFLCMAFGLGASGALFFSHERIPAFAVEGRMRMIAVVVLACVGAAFVFVGGSQLLAARMHAQGEKNQSLTQMERAATMWYVPLYARDAARAYYAYAVGLTTEAEFDTLKHAIERATAMADRAVAADPRDLPSLIFRASLYTSLVPFGFPDAETRANESITMAEAAAPNRPEVPYLRAVLDMQRGDTESARTNAKRALERKSDYEDANALLLQLDGKK